MGRAGGPRWPGSSASPGRARATPPRRPGRWSAGWRRPGSARSSPTSTPATSRRRGSPPGPAWWRPKTRSTGSGSGAASELEGDPGGVVVAAAAAVLGPAVDEGAGLAGGQARAEPDLVEQLVVGRLAGFLEAVGPGARGRGWGVVGLGGP